MRPPEGAEVLSCGRCGRNIFQETSGRWVAVGSADSDQYCKGGKAHAPAGSLFELGAFILPSGRTTHFKIECDVLQEKDWQALARIGAALLPPFGVVEGVPRGGIEFARALEQYTTPTSSVLLIADDVWVTGLSMERHRDGRDAIGIVAFTRNNVADWVTPLLYLSPRAEEATYQLDKQEFVS